MSVILNVIIGTIALLFFCWMLAEYYFRDIARHTGSDKRLRFGTRTAFVLSHFWKTVDDAKELPREAMREDLGNIPQSYRREDSHFSQPHHAESARTQEPLCNSKSYRTKKM